MCNIRDQLSWHGFPTRGISRTRVGNPCHAWGRPGFSFTEILFAVMVLGIGFIMIAAIFPVAIKQTQATSEETNASTIAKGGVDYFEKIATNGVMPVTAPSSSPQPPGLVVASGPFWLALQGNLILPSDPRYAWVPMYKRDIDLTTGVVSPYAQVIIIGVQVRNRTTYSAAVDLSSPPTPPTLQARPVLATITPGTPPAADTITFAPDPSGNNIGAVAEGSFVVVANDPGTVVTNPAGTTPAQQIVSANGWVYRVGNFLSSTATTSTWELAPGNDTLGATYKPAAQMQVMIVGRGYDNPSANNGVYSGPAQDIAVYTTFVTVAN